MCQMLSTFNLLEITLDYWWKIIEDSQNKFMDRRIWALEKSPRVFEG
jgi:hypothetical protein